MKYIKLTIIEKTLLVTINRPDKLNALNTEILDELSCILTENCSNDKVRCIVITGAGDKSFVAGADIKEMSTFNCANASEYSMKGINLFNTIESYSKPIISAVNGYALGGGLELALSSHIRYSSQNAVFALPEVTLGLIPGYGGTQRLRNIVGLGHACEMIFSGKLIDSQRALSIGLVNKITKNDVVDESIELANKISKNSPVAIKSAIQSTVSGLNQFYYDSFNIENNLFSSLFDSEDTKEGIDAFLEKRKPNFKGK